MDDIASPHDTFFRESFSRREIATDLLRWHLPADLLAEIDLDTLEISKDSYVSSDLRSAYSDLVYRVQHRDGPLGVYLLFEHKSRPEHWTLLQLLLQPRAESQSCKPLSIVTLNKACSRACSRAKPPLSCASLSAASARRAKRILDASSLEEVLH